MKSVPEKRQGDDMVFESRFLRLTDLLWLYHKGLLFFVSLVFLVIPFFVFLFHWDIAVRMACLISFGFGLFFFKQNRAFFGYGGD